MIYYAHSKQIYNTKREKKELAYIVKNCTATIVVDPNKDMGELGSMQPYLEKVRKCSSVVCSEYKKHIGYGVYQEVAEVLRIKKKVYVLRKSLFHFYLKRVKRIEIVDMNDWTIYYGRIVCAKFH